MNGSVGGKEKRGREERGEGRLLWFDGGDFGSSLGSLQRDWSFEETGPSKSLVL
jgi:hypothetical protein